MLTNETVIVKLNDEIVTVSATSLDTNRLPNFRMGIVFFDSSHEHFLTNSNFHITFMCASDVKTFNYYFGTAFVNCMSSNEITFNSDINHKKQLIENGAFFVKEDTLLYSIFMQSM